MPQTAIYFSDVNERQGAFHRRTFLLGGLAGGGILALTARLGYLQLLESGRYQKLAASNQFNFKLVPPPRGLILDRNGVVLASNRPNFRLLVRREEDLDHEAMLKTLANYVPLDPQRQARLAKEIDRSPRRVPVQVMEDMTWDQFSAINLRAPELPGVVADMGEVRVYPHGGAFAHVIGYVAKPIKEDIKDTGPNADPILLHPGFRIGRQGVEKAFDLELRGKPGAQKVEVDANGREVRHDPDGDIPAIPGKQIQLTLDVDVQTRAIEVFGEESGAAVMMDCRTGDLLCLASAPSFDANRFVRGLSGPEYRALANYERRPLLDKALSGLYPPGSTFKTMTALAALDAGIDPNARIFCGGGWHFGRYFHCHKRGGHGPQDMRDALKNSCDVYFYQVALRIGPDQIAKIAKAFGFEQIFDIGISGQKKGIVPSREWKRRYFKKNPANQEWMPGESLSYGIGQGALQVNALQLAVMTARLANGRKALNPRLIKSLGDEVMPPGSEAPDLPFKKEHIDYVREGMAAVTEAGGTGFRASQLGLGDILMAGKTGTAQVRNYSAGGGRGKGGPWKYRDHGLFVCFAPIDEPRYALSVVVQHGMGGSTAAAPRAREIMRVALLKDPELRARIEQPLPMPEMPAEGEADLPDPPSVIAPDAAPPGPPIAAPPGAPA
jgi:penicillin-binding protein 2